MEKKENFLKNARVLITGGTGSFGRAFIRRVLKEHSPASIVVYSRDEMKQFMMRQDPAFQDERLRFFIGDIRDKERLSRAMNGVDFVVHAAAMKIVPDAEYNPFECVKTNILGAQNVIECCMDNNVKKTIALSTDKAANPVNLYGATKLVSDKIFVNGNVYAAHSGSRFSCVRYGNVTGSRGSVIPFFRERAKKGNIPITDVRMTRFFITLDQAVEFVLKNFERMVGGEVFVPKIPSMKITDLAEVVAPGVPQTEIGIRAGEKLHELMIGEDDARHTYEYDDYFTIYPEHPEWGLGKEKIPVGKKCPNQFSYSSDNNTDWLSGDAMRELLQGQGLL